MLESIKNIRTIKRIRKTKLYSRIRSRFPMPEKSFVNDSEQIDDAEIVKIDWPSGVSKPTIGIVQDFGKYPKWTKYCRFLENNEFNYSLYNIHRHDWIEESENYDVVIGLPSNTIFHLQEIRCKYYILETFLGKKCYPSVAHALLYEDKCLEAYISQLTNIPFAKTYITHDKEDALTLAYKLKFPLVHKIVPSSGSYGVELLPTVKKGIKIVREAFSVNGRKTHTNLFRQKDYVYFQDYIPNDGYDIRAIVVGNWVFGYYRKTLEGDFRASGMDFVEMRELPKEAMTTARKVNDIINSPVLAVDMILGLDGKYHIIEFSPFYQMDSPGELQVNGIPGVYIFSSDGSYRFVEGRYWVAELAIREFLLRDYLPNNF
jgi:glutathione synthase/RimK-type ligase-like ATP-grasp enzyme